MSIAAQMEVFKGASTALRVKAWGSVYLAKGNIGNKNTAKG